MPFKKDNPDPRGGINSLKYHKTIINRIVNDVTLSANRRFLAELIYMWMCAYGREKEVIEALLLGAGFTKFQDNRGLRLRDEEDPTERDSSDKETLQINSNITDTLRLIEEKNNGSV